MGIMDAMMNMMLKTIGKEKREKMMIEMMPRMMEGIDIHELMPKMMEEMLKDVSVDDVVVFIKRAVNEQDKLKEMAGKVLQTNPMRQMMFKVYPSKMGFDETVEAIRKKALEVGWQIPDVRDLQKEYIDAGISDMTRMKILYFCNPRGGYDILKEDDDKAMSVMMPTGVSVYETSDGRVEAAAMNMSLMSGMFTGIVKEVLGNGGENLEKTLNTVVDRKKA